MVKSFTIRGKSNMSKVSPLRDRIVVRRQNEHKTPGGIVIPETVTANEKPMFGIVVAVGPGKTLENGEIQEPAVKVNDKVLFGKYAGTEIELDGESLVVMREDDIMAVIVG